MENFIEDVKQAADAVCDAAQKFMDDVKDAALSVMEAVYAGVMSIKDAWDNLDPGLKQWIVMGVSMAVSFIPLVGPLVSCIIDGTFVDMLKAISTGDWAMLALSCAAFVPGMKAFKGLKVLSGVTKASKVSALEKLALKAKTGERTFKCTTKSAEHIAEKHLDDIAKNSGSGTLADTMNAIKREWNAVSEVKPSRLYHDPPRSIYYSDNMKFVVEPETSTIVSMMWR